MELQNEKVTLTFVVEIDANHISYRCDEANYELDEQWDEDANIVPNNAWYNLHQAMQRTVGRFIESDGLYDGPRKDDKSYIKARKAGLVLRKRASKSTN